MESGGKSGRNYMMITHNYLTISLVKQARMMPQGYTMSEQIWMSQNGGGSFAEAGGVLVGLTDGADFS